MNFCVYRLHTEANTKSQQQSSDDFIVLVHALRRRCRRLFRFHFNLYIYLVVVYTTRYRYVCIDVLSLFRSACLRCVHGCISMYWCVFLCCGTFRPSGKKTMCSMHVVCCCRMNFELSSQLLRFASVAYAFNDACTDSHGANACLNCLKK